MKKLTKLSFVDLEKNKVKTIPRSILELNIEIFYNYSIENYGMNLFENPIEESLLEVIKQGKESVLEWFEATKKKLEEIKIILIGEPKTRKTSLLRRFKSIL